MSQSQNKDTRSASQKITDLENALMSLYQTADNMARDLGTIKEAIKLLGNKVDSIVKAASAGEPVNDAVIARIMVENNVEELNQKVKLFVAQGMIKTSEQVTSDSFIVGSEIAEDGTVVNPRLQFALSALTPEMQTKFVGGKAGDVLNLQEGKLKFKIAEVYEIQKPKPAQAAQAAEAVPEAAPAAEASAEASQPAAEATSEQSATSVQ